MRFLTYVVIQLNKQNKIINNKVCLNNVMDTICSFPRYSVDKEGTGDKGRKRLREREEKG